MAEQLESSAEASGASSASAAMAPGAAIAAALARAQGQMRSVSKDREVQVQSDKGRSYGFRYATLAAIWDVIRKPLSDNHLAVVQLVTVGDDRHVAVETKLLHSSGESIASTCVLPVSNPSPQGVGSALTYCRRYGLSALLGVVSDDDDDGQEASRSAAGPQASAQRKGRQKPEEPTGPVVAFGPLKGHPIASLTFEALADTAKFGEAKLQAEPEAAWAPAVRANVEALRAELARREQDQATEPSEPPRTEGPGKARRRRPAGPEAS